ncbi:hypothetical protein HPP92_002750 [Vanilla planifolia]|uniref:Uncharacterized protein n=1 Tax=Vanilla planifolia TaxID=51239 RepID=A0A835RYQ8_VANPL|nr:hypothetical protein HPP92_002750 [Vanilla planifolia]
MRLRLPKLSKTQSSLVRQLELIETHQREVDKSLQSMEAEAERLFKEERSLLFEDDAASKRDSMFEKAEFIESELERMTEQIKSIIQTFNAKQGVDMDLTDNMTPIDAAARILNNQLSSLMWIDEKANDFSAQIQKLGKHGSSVGDSLSSKFWLT